jgi:RNA polymerase sigma-70 factor (ECF subfamily)
MIAARMKEIAVQEAFGDEQPVTEVMTDDELVKAIRAGDEDAFRTLFKRHRHSVARVALRFFSRREQAEEIVQEAFTKAYFALENYRGGHELSFVSWLSQITVRACYDELRRTKRRSESYESDLSDDEVSYLQTHFESKYSGRRLEGETISRDLAEKLLARLSPEDRLALMLVNGEEMPVADVAKLTGWSEGKVKTRAMRARNSLRSILHRFV